MEPFSLSCEHSMQQLHIGNMNLATAQIQQSVPLHRPQFIGNIQPAVVHGLGERHHQDMEALGSRVGLAAAQQKRCDMLAERGGLVLPGLQQQPLALGSQLVEHVELEHLETLAEAQHLLLVERDEVDR